HCDGRSVPDHICDPMTEPSDEGHPGHGSAHAHAEPGAAAPHTAHGAPAATAGHDGAHGDHEPPSRRSAQDVMGHGGGHGMSMDDMVRDMRNRFLVAALLSIPIVLWSPIGRDVLGINVPTPFGLRDDVVA